MDFDLDNPFGFTLRDDANESARADQAWNEFASAVGYHLSGVASGAALAELINNRAVPDLMVGTIFQYLNELTDSAIAYPASANAARLTDVFNGVRREIVAAAIASEANITERRRDLSRMADAAHASGILALSKAAAHAYGRPLSSVLSALLSKLAREAEELPEAVRPAADRAFRDLVKHLFDFWSVRSVDISAGYDALFTAQNETRTTSSAGSAVPEAERVLQLAFESGATGSVVWSALTQLNETPNGARRILDMIKRAPLGSRAAELIAQQFATPIRLNGLLHEDPVDFSALDALLKHMGTAAAPPLLDALAEAKSRTIRRGLLDRLGALGAGIGPLAVERLKSDERWYVKRNMLTLLREAKCALDQVPLESYSGHADARVRREVTQLLVQKPGERERAIAVALRDADVNMMKIGLRAARASLPESIVPLLARRVVEPHFPPEFRRAALQLLARSNSVLALEALLRFVLGGTTLLGKPKLAAKSAEMLIALGGIARNWPNERRASVLIALARESKDPDIAKAVTVGARAPLSEEKDALDDE